MEAREYLSQFSRDLADRIMNARTQPSPASQGSKRVLEQWEPQEIGQMMDNAFEVNFEPEVLEPTETLKVANGNIKAIVADLVKEWPEAPPRDVMSALCVVALYVRDDHIWSATNDIVATRIIDLLFDQDFRAHADGVFQYLNGGWVPIEEFKYPVVRRLLAIIGVAAKFLKRLVQVSAPRDLAKVCEVLKDCCQGISSECQACHADFRSGRDRGDSAWAREGGSVLLDLTQRYAQRGKASDFLESYGEFFQIPRPSAKEALVNLDNVTLQVSLVGGPADRFRALKKSPQNDCYLNIPVSLDYKPAQHHEDMLRLFLCTSFAGNAAGRMIDLASEAHVWYDLESPQVAIVFVGDGGNAKSARATLRANVFGTAHHFVSAEVLQTPEEFRKQGMHFARARIATLQENQGGMPWIEDVAKRLISGECIACRPLFGKTTELYNWRKTRIYFEWNRTYPSVRGDWRNIASLRSFWRRLLVIELGCSFTSDSKALSVDKRVFEEKDLTQFLESPEARLIYVRSFLMPFIQSHTAEECRQLLKSPPDHIVEATKRVVVQMANGGLELPPEWHSQEQRMQAQEQAKGLLVNVHKWFGDETHMKLYDLVKKAGNPLPGSRTGRRSGQSKEAYFQTAVQDYPFLFHIDGRDVFKLNVDIAKLQDLLASVGPSIVGGGLEDWGSLWQWKSELVDDFVEHDVSVEIQGTPSESEEPVATLDETINSDCLKRALSGAMGEKAELGRRLLQRHSQEGRRQADMSTISVTYKRKHGVPGRRYAQGPSLQMLSKGFRESALGSPCVADAPLCNEHFENFDLDISNCFPQLLWNEIKNLIGISVDIDYPILTAFVSNPEAFRRFLADYLGQPIKIVKKELIRIMHCGRPKDDLPLFWALAVELRRAATALLEEPRFTYLRGMFESRRHPFATRLHFALASIEDKLIGMLQNALTDAFEEQISFVVYMFDGMVVQIKNTGNAQKLQEVVDAFSAQNGIKLTIRKL